MEIKNIESNVSDLFGYIISVKQNVEIYIYIEQLK